MGIQELKGTSIEKNSAINPLNAFYSQEGCVRTIQHMFKYS